MTIQDRLRMLLDEAKTRPPMTGAELQAQRESWVRGEMAIGLDADEAIARAKGVKP